MLSFLLALVLMFLPGLAEASNDSLQNQPYVDLDVRGISYRLILVSTALLALILFITVLIKKRSEAVKRLLFWSMTTVIIGATAFLTGLTIMANQLSWSKGPIHWHADFEIWNCGEGIELVDPSGFSNRVGSPEFHEHNDKRIHFEGVVMNQADATLGTFFNEVGGELTSQRMDIQTPEGMQSLASGQRCADGQTAQLQTFVYTVNDDNTYSQRKVNNPASYIMSHESQVPPGDCIIFEFGPVVNRTDRLCQSYETANITGKLKGEVQ